MMKSVIALTAILAVVAVVVVEAQHPRHCEAPHEFEAHASQFDHKEKFSRWGHVAYDATHERISVFEDVRNGTDEEFYHVIHLFREHRRYRFNLKTKVCTTEIINEHFRPIGIYREARFVGEAVIGTNAFENSGLLTTHWAHENKTAGFEWYGVFTDRDKGCIPVTDDFFDKNTVGHVSTQYFDVVLGISDPNVFIPESQCSREITPVKPAQPEEEAGLETSGDASKFVSGEFVSDMSQFPVNSKSGWALFKQCDPAWANQQLGTCSLTICQAGCAMSSVAMLLKTKGVNTNPSILDKWLTSSGGYEGGCNIIWSKVDAFGKTSFQGIETAAYDTVCAGIQAGHGIIGNVRGGSHWVLLTGCDGNNNFFVNDPGFDQSKYSYSDVLREAVYH